MAERSSDCHERSNFKLDTVPVIKLFHSQLSSRMG
jgi:hypothetical protein